MEKTLKKNPDQEVLYTPNEQSIAHFEPEAKLDIDFWVKTRQEFKTKVGSIMVEKVDYSIIKDKKSLGKAGAEKIASIFNWAAEFKKDTETWEMLGSMPGILCYICILTDRATGRFVGEGRGTRDMKQDNGDTNKCVKMATKSAHIDAVIRASGLSDIFTQDLEDMNPNDIGLSQYPNHSSSEKAASVSEKQLELIKKLCQQKGYTKEDLYNNGFTKLTGGKDGTASELIDWLLKAPVKDYLEEMNKQKEFQDIGDSIN